MNGFLNPVKNAKAIGSLFIMGAIVGIFFGGFKLEEGELLLNFLYLFTNLILPLIIGIGLIKKKIWAIYVLGISSLMGLISYLFIKSNINLIYSAIYFFFAIRFGNSRDEFEEENNLTNNNLYSVNKNFKAKLIPENYKESSLSKKSQSRVNLKEENYSTKEENTKHEELTIQENNNTIPEQQIIITEEQNSIVEEKKFINQNMEKNKKGKKKKKSNTIRWIIAFSPIRGSILIINTQKLFTNSGEVGRIISGILSFIFGISIFLTPIAIIKLIISGIRSAFSRRK